MAERGYLEMIQAEALTFGVDRLAPFLNCKVSTLYAKLNPNENPSSNHRLAVVEWDIIMAKTGSRAALCQFAYEHGMLATPIPRLGVGGLDEEELLRHLAQSSREHSEKVAAILATHPAGQGAGQRGAKELLACIKEVRESIGEDTYLLQLLEGELKRRNR